ncbi:hypothetical protein C1646_661547 [Rhizophagus diaphanus]|nr:hypothetical protein C1646_661547 [Rhizophagus diaphanus] [Rhizophagus sp. MUCL 43196]
MDDSIQIHLFYAGKSLMLEQRYEISTSLPSIDFLKEYNDEISSNDKFEHEMLNETLDNTSDIHFEDSEKKKKNDCETFEHDEVIDNLEHTEFISCVVIDFIKGKVQQYGESTKLKQLQNLFGTWQVNRNAINKVDGVLIRLGCCCWCYKNLGGHIHHHPGRGKSGTTCTTLYADNTAKEIKKKLEIKEKELKKKEIEKKEIEKN